MTRKFEGGTLVLATHNKGKLKEIREMLEGRGIDVRSAADFSLESPEETGTTFLANATLKAVFVAKATGHPALADDSGLCVNALSGEPGVYTADWAEATPGGPRDFHAAMKKVHDRLGDAPDRSAAFVCCLALAFPDGHVEHTEGRIPGQITWPPRGAGGFGYDPVFLPDGYDVTYAELPAAEKNRHSHRARAFSAMMKKCF